MPRRRSEQLAQTRAAILDAAERCFAEDGVAGATVKRIAGEASVTIPTVYAHFAGGKAALLEALEARVGQEIDRLTDLQIPAGLTFAQKLELLLGHQFRLVEASHARFQFILDARVPQTLGALYLASLTKWLTEHDERGELRFEPAFAAQVITGTWGACLRVWARRGAPPGELVALAPRVADTLTGGLVARAP